MNVAHLAVFANVSAIAIEYSTFAIELTGANCFRLKLSMCSISKDLSKDQPELTFWKVAVS